MTSVDEFMQGGNNYPQIKINSVGGKLVGDLVEARLVDERDFDTGQIVTWDDNTPRKQLVLDTRVDWAASVDVTTGKDGTREEIGSYFCRFTAKLALQEACETAGIVMSKVGRFAIQRTPDGVPRNPRHKPPQQFVAQVAQRTAEPGVDNMMAATAQPAAAPAAAAPPAQQPAAAAPAPGSLLG